jgi:DNA repair exonuclease SbcCD ATPase subunit
MTSEIQTIRRTLEQRKGAWNKVKEDLRGSRKERTRQVLRLQQTENALEISKQVGLKTQQELEYHISNLVSAAISSVFPDNPYKFRALFIERRGKTECDLMLERDGELIDALHSAGGGVVDVTTLALRIASLSMKSGRIRPVLLLDEPFKHLSIDLQDRAEQMLHELATKVGIQVICNSHASSAVENTDKAFQISIEDGISQVESGITY